MFTPHFELTHELLSLLANIERVYGQLEELRLPRNLQLNLERNNLVQSAFVSNSIEGNPLSLPEVTNLLLGDRVPTNRSEKEVANYFALLKRLPTIETFSLDTVLALHKSLLTGVDGAIAGVIRNRQVVIGRFVGVPGDTSLEIKHNPPFHTREAITQAVQELLVWVADSAKQTLPILRAGIFHHQYVYIHPFADGNGRTCRLLTALLLIQSGYQVNKYFVLDDYYDIDRQEYSDMLSSADRGDLTQWLTYFASGVYYSMQSALAKARNSLSTLDVPKRPTPREAELLKYMETNAQLTTREVAVLFGVSRQAAYNLLAGLVDKGLITRHGTTKNSYYELLT